MLEVRLRGRMGREAEERSEVGSSHQHVSPLVPVRGRRVDLQRLHVESTAEESALGASIRCRRVGRDNNKKSLDSFQVVYLST